MYKIYILFVVLLTLSGCNPNNGMALEPADKFISVVDSRQSHFTVEVSTEDNGPLPVGKYHNWIISIEDQSGSVVENALFSIGGGMPSHGHGLPTQPLVTKYLGNGNYLMEGIKFNMDGPWVLKLTITANNRQDVAQFDFNVTY